MNIAYTKSQGGVVLLEALVAVVIFAIGVLGLVGLQTRATQNTTEEIARANAIELAETYISQLRTTHAVNAQPNWYSGYLSGGTNYSAWQTLVQAQLPGSTIQVSIVPVTDQLGVCTVQIVLGWTARVGANSHSLTFNTQV